MNEFGENRLAQRLRTLEPKIDSNLLARRVLARPAPARSSHRLLIATLSTPLVLFVALALSSYFAPVFAQALADAPIGGSVTGAMLRSVGLAGVPHRVTSFGDVASSSGYGVELVGGYADSGRTILFARVTPAARVVPGTLVRQEFTLTDQFGATYRFTAGIANSATGENTFIFEPLRWPATLLGARLHLAFNTVDPNVVPGEKNEVTGHWYLGGTLALDEGRDLPLPDDAVIAPIRIAFTKVRATQSALLVNARIDAGGLDLQRMVPDAGKGHHAFAITLVDDHGVQQSMLQANSGSSGGATESSWIWLVEHPGRYELRVAYEGVGNATRTIQVP